jgi:hypothetical protein
VAKIIHLSHNENFIFLPFRIIHDFGLFTFYRENGSCPHEPWRVGALSSAEQRKMVREDTNHGGWIILEHSPQPDFSLTLIDVTDGYVAEPPRHDGGVWRLSGG